jgi:hypothetical protein
MKSKNFVSLSISLIFISIAITGLWLFTGQKVHAVETTHSLLGVLFVGFAIFHIANNWSSWKGYVGGLNNGGIRKEFVISIILVGVIVAGAALSLPPFEEMSRAGKALFGNRRTKPRRVTFEEIYTNQDKNGTALTLTIRKDKSVLLPVIAIWTEDTVGHVVDNLFVPGKALAPENSEEDLEEVIAEGELEDVNFDPAVLPTFNSRVGSIKANYEESTPADDFILHTKTSQKSEITLFVEVNSVKNHSLYKVKVDPKQNVRLVPIESGLNIIHIILESD